MSIKIPPNQQAFFEQASDFVRKVPHGRVVTYGQIAQALSEHKDLDFEDSEVSGSRLVGSAMAACPVDVPWHRVINAQGRVSSWVDASRQQLLLEKEGLCFLQGRLDLNECQWLGPDQADKPKQHQLF